MPTSFKELHGAALIASTYHITVKVLPRSSPGRYHTHIRAVENPTEQLPAREHRSFRIAANDWKHKHFTWDASIPDRGMKARPIIRTVSEVERDRKNEKMARDIQNLAQQKGERVPDKREALAMASLMKSAEMVVSFALSSTEFGVTEGKEFLIIDDRLGDAVEASLYVDGKGEKKFVVKGVGVDHYNAFTLLENELIEQGRQMRQEKHVLKRSKR